MPIPTASGHHAPLRSDGPSGTRGFRRWCPVPLGASAVCLAGAVLLNDPGAAGTPPTPTPAPPTASDSTETYSAETLDRQLRQEQIDVALSLASDFPASDDAHYLVGLIFNDQGNSEQAEAYWRKSLALDPTRADAHRDLGYQLLLREDFDAALEQFRLAITNAPQVEEYRMRLAHGQLLAGQPAETLVTLEKIAVLSAPAQRLRGQAYQHLGEFSKARAAYELALRLQPDLTEAYYGLAVVCARLGDKDSAARHQKRFNELQSDSQTLGRRKHTEFDPLSVTRASVARTHTDVARVYFNQANPTKGEELLIRAAEVDPSDSASRYLLAMFYQKTGRTKAAILVCRELTRIEPDNPVHRLSLGNLLVRDNALAEAEQVFRQVIALAPERAEGFFSLAQLLLQTQNDLPEALRCATRSAELNPAAPNLYVLARAQAAAGSYSSALASAEKAYRAAPTNPQFRELYDQLRRHVGTPSP